MVIMDLLILIAVVLTTAYFQLKPLHWAVIIGATLLCLSVFGHFGVILTLAWVIFFFAAIFALLPELRKRILTGKLMTLLRKRLPPLSQTEVEAIQSGDVWWEKELLCGSPNWDKLLSYPRPTLTPEEQAFIDNQVNHLCSMLNDWQIVRNDHDLPQKVWQYLRQERFFGLVIPKEYGGHGFSALAHSMIVSKVACRSMSAAVNMMVPNSLGPGELLLHYGTVEQKNYYLPRLASGVELPCFALTGVDAGSDAGSITDSGRVCYQRFEGVDTLGISLNWDKRYITLAPVATLLGLAIHLYDPQHLLGEQEDIGITLCLIPTSHRGVDVGRRHWPLYLSFMNGPTSGNEVFIPLSWIIGGPAMAGQGWRMLMECLSIGRSISLPALSIASGQLAYRITGAYARIRRQFNMPIGYFEGIEEMLSAIAGSTYILEATRRLTAGAVDQKVKPAIASAMAKYHMTEMARQVINHAMDIHAGHGIQAGPRNLLANVYLALPISITVEGANALTRNLIIFGQGSVICHPYLLRELELLGSTKPEAREAFDGVFLSHLSYTFCNLARSVWYALTGGRLIRVPLSKPLKPAKLKYYYQQLTVVSTLLAIFTDWILLLLGGNLKRRERISARLGDIWSQLYLSSAVLKFYHDNGQPEDEWPSVQWTLQTLLQRSQTAFKELTSNFPNRFLGWVLGLLIPRSRVFRGPSDQLSHQIVAPLLSPSSLRDRLTAPFYVNPQADEWLSDLERTFSEVADIEPLLKKYQKAVQHDKVQGWKTLSEQLQAAVLEGLLTKIEAARLLDYEEQKRKVIQVSELSFDLHTVVN